MTLARDMGRLAVEFEAAQVARLAAVEGIKMSTHQSLAAGRAALRQIMADHAKTLDADLKGIFSQAAFIRGTAKDMIDQFAAERESFAAERKTNATLLRADLDEFMAGLEADVEKLLTEYREARKAMGAREAAARQIHLKDLQVQADMLVSSAAAFIDRLAKDREKAGRIRSRHSQALHKQRRAAAPPKTAKSGSKGAKKPTKAKAAPKQNRAKVAAAKAAKN